MTLSGLSTHDLACSRGYRDLFAGLCLQVQPGQILRVEGRNGSGKTSLLRILAGLAQPVSGDVLWNGLKIHDPQTEYFQNRLYIGHKPGQADHQQTEFLRTGNPYYQAERARMDDLSALYFMAAQIGLGAFIAFLVSD